MIDTIELPTRCLRRKYKALGLIVAKQSFIVNGRHLWAVFCKTRYDPNLSSFKRRHTITFIVDLTDGSWSRPDKLGATFYAFSTLREYIERFSEVDV